MTCKNFRQGFLPSCKGFTLIEVLVVVLIIGILTSIALPQYQKAVEKTRMSEAVVLVKAIVNANQIFHTTYQRYAAHDELDLLDIDIPGETPSQTSFNKRRQTQYFTYSPGGIGVGNNNNHLAVALRHNKESFSSQCYLIYVHESEPDRIRCTAREEASSIQRKLCSQLDETGTL